MSPGPEDDLGEPIDDEPIRRRQLGWVARLAGVLAALGLIGASVAVLVGGGDDDQVVTDPEVDGVLTAEDLVGRTFAVVAVERGGQPVALAAQPPVLAFGDTRLQLRTGCNGTEGDFHVVDGELLFFGGDMDLRACAGTTGAQEQAVLDLFLDLGTEPVEQRLHPEAHLAGALLQLRLRDAAAWAVDVTEQPAVGGAIAVAASEAVARHLAPSAVDDLPVGSLGAAPAGGFGSEAIVTVLTEPDATGAREAEAIVVATEPAVAIVRLPEGGAALAPPQGATVAPGDRITYDGVPVEGTAAAHVNGVEVPVDVDHDALVTSFVVPSWARGEIVVTLSLASPEVPTATAAWYRVSR